MISIAINTIKEAVFLFGALAFAVVLLPFALAVIIGHAVAVTLSAVVACVLMIPVFAFDLLGIAGDRIARRFE